MTTQLGTPNIIYRFICFCLAFTGDGAVIQAKNLISSLLSNKRITLSVTILIKSGTIFISLPSCIYGGEMCKTVLN